MISPTPHTHITFTDVPLTDPSPRFVVESLAAVLASGFWYDRSGEPWLQDVTLGKLHMQDFKAARREQLRREIIARMEGAVIVIEGAPMTAPDVAALFARDAAFRARCARLPEFAGIAAKIAQALPQARAFNARQHERSLILPVHGSTHIKQLLADEYED